MTFNFLKNIIAVILINIISFQVSSGQQQNSSIDSLKIAANNAKTDSAKHEIFRYLVNEFINNQKFDSAIYYIENSLNYYTKANNREKLLMTKTRLATLYTYNNENEKGMNLIKEVQSQIKSNDKDQLKANVNFSLAVVYFYNKDYNTALEKFKLITDEYKAGKEIPHDLVSNSYYYISNINNIILHRYSEALKYGLENLEFTQKHVPSLVEDAQSTLALLYSTIKDFDKSRAYYFDILKELNKEKSYKKAAYINEQIGTLFFKSKNYDSAITYLNKSLEYYQNNGLKSEVASVYNVLSAISFNEKNYAKAEQEIKKSIELTDPNADGILYHKSFLGTVLLTQLFENDSVNVDKQELSTITQNLESNFKQILIKNEEGYLSQDLIIHNYNVLSKAYKLMGNYEKALDYYQKGNELIDSIYKISSIREMTEKQGEIEKEKESAKIKFEEESKRLQLQKEIDLKNIIFEFEKKQALAKSEEERKRLLLEEELKRKEIEIKYEEEQKSIKLKFEQETAIAKVEQEKKDALNAAEIKRSNYMRNMSLAGAGLALLLVAIALWSYYQKRKDNKRIAEEKEKSDNLLLNILPLEVAEELKENGSTVAQKYDEVSVLFTDFVNFTLISEKLGVQELLNELNIYFTAFDNIMLKYGLEKIKTIGDAYLSVCGLPTANPKHAQQTVLAALDILDFVENRKKDTPYALDIRIGINSGSLIAGIVGIKKFAYDIWGDTVNTAARMEQSGEVGKINISENTYQLIKAEFDCTHRGKIAAKGKGEMDMYFVENKK